MQDNQFTIALSVTGEAVFAPDLDRVVTEEGLVVTDIDAAHYECLGAEYRSCGETYFEDVLVTVAVDILNDVIIIDGQSFDKLCQVHQDQVIDKAIRLERY